MINITLTIIAGTHTFVDLTGKFRAAWARAMQRRVIYDIDGVRFAKSRFERVEITKEGKVIQHPRLINPIDNKFYRWTVNQPTGSCKTILAVYNISRVWARGGNIAANFSYQWMKHNIGKPRDKWTPNLTSMDDFMKLKNTHVTIDDIKGTAESWHSEESELIGQASNLARKDGVNLDITSQGVTNFVAPNIRRITTGYEIPYCTIRDQRLPSPDGRGYPRVIEVISLIPGDMQIGDIFVGFGMLTNDIPDGRQVTPSIELLNSYKSMEIATGLKSGADGARPNQPGYDVECKALEFLKEHFKPESIEHLNGKNVFDLVTPTHAFDVCSMDADGNLISDHKNLLKHLSTARKTGKMPYLMFPYHNTWGFMKITSRVSNECSGKRINTSYIPIRGIDGVLK